jgi:hypothetical protein
MRGTDRTQSTMFSYVSPEARIPVDHPLRAPREMDDRVWDVTVFTKNRNRLLGGEQRIVDC